ANHFTIFDNTFLNQRYIENLIATTPSGMFTERGIYGRWVSGEGAVYRDFKEDMLISSKDIPTDDITIYYAGVDWGYEHHGSIVVCGQTADGRVYLLEEHSAQYQEIDYWVEIAKDIKSQYGNIYFYADSARPEHVARFEREHLKCVNADKSVLSGIEQVAKLMKQGRFFVCSEKVEKFKDEVYQYVWNEKTGEPEKKNDDVLDALRYAIYSHMAKPKAKVKRKSLFGL
ncbi:phage terminase large subunit family protein, partial [Streptococcus suis]